MAKANKTFQIAARITEQEKEMLIDYCDRNDITVAQLIRKAIKEYLEKYKED